VTDFAEELFHRKKANRSPMHLVVEEAQVFVPQRTMGDEARMLGAFEDLVKLGRNFGIGVTLISQRPQSVNKDALNQTECLVVLQTNGAQERKAIEAWIVEQGLDVGELVDTLPSLERGEAWVWSPSWLRKTLPARAEAGRGVQAVRPD
jgi:DNA helicase HerA-like ATPase